MRTELALELIGILGEEKILRAYQLTKSEPVSFAMLKKYLQRQKLFIQLKTAKYQSVAAIAKKHKVSRMSVYRMMHSIKRSSKQSNRNP